MSPVDVTSSIQYSNNTNAGTATATASWAGNASHTGSTGSANFVIAPASSAITVTCTAGATYTGSAQTPCTAQATGAGMSPVDVTSSIVYGNNIDAGIATADASWNGDVNHAASASSGSFTIGLASSVTVVTCPSSVNGDGTPQTPCTAQATGAGMSPVDVTSSIVYGNNIDAGTATADVSWVGDANHTGSSDSATFTIN